MISDEQSLHFLAVFLATAFAGFFEIFLDLPADFLTAFLGLEAEVFLVALGLAGDLALAGDLGLAGDLDLVALGFAGEAGAAATGATTTAATGALVTLATLGLAVFTALALTTLGLDLDADFFDWIVIEITWEREVALAICKLYRRRFRVSLIYNPGIIIALIWLVIFEGGKIAGLFFCPWAFLPSHCL